MSRFGTRPVAALAFACIVSASLAAPAAASDPEPDAQLLRGLPARVDRGPSVAKAGPAVGAAAFPGTPGEIAFNRSAFDAYPWGISTLSATLTTGGIGTGDSSPAYSPGGTLLAFSRDQTADLTPVEDIWVMKPDGTGQRRLTTSAADDFGPAWTPDGSRILFATNRDGNYEIYSMAYDGTDVRRVTTNAATDIQPSVSPDGTKIAFSSNRGTSTNFDIYVMNTNGSNVVRLTTDAGGDFAPDWSPDGTTLAFHSDRTGDFEVYTMSPSGSNVVNLTLDPTSDDFASAWSPDGGAVAFTSDYYGDYDIWLVGAAGGDPVLVTDTYDDEFYPTWQPIPAFPLVDARFSPFRFDIEWLYGEGITSGCTAELYCPTATVTRGQMAAFLVRALALPATTEDFFTDDETSIFENEINRLAAAGITTGCTATTYCPTATVTRGQMAAFLHRAMD
jgi:dipeptidyl aminopeptidase/acylaminoacyl peptidase